MTFNAHLVAARHPADALRAYSVELDEGMATVWGGQEKDPALTFGGVVDGVVGVAVGAAVDMAASSCTHADPTVLVLLPCEDVGLLRTVVWTWLSQTAALSTVPHVTLVACVSTPEAAAALASSPYVASARRPAVAGAGLEVDVAHAALWLAGMPDCIRLEASGVRAPSSRCCGVVCLAVDWLHRLPVHVGVGRAAGWEYGWERDEWRLAAKPDTCALHPVGAAAVFKSVVRVAGGRPVGLVSAHRAWCEAAAAAAASHLVSDSCAEGGVHAPLPLAPLGTLWRACCADAPLHVAASQFQDAPADGVPDIALCLGGRVAWAVAPQAFALRRGAGSAFTAQDFTTLCVQPHRTARPMRSTNPALNAGGATSVSRPGGHWGGVARAEHVLALLRLAAFDAAVGTRGVGVLASQTDGKWGTPSVFPEVSRDLVSAMLCGASAVLGMPLLPNCGLPAMDWSTREPPATLSVPWAVGDKGLVRLPCPPATYPPRLGKPWPFVEAGALSPPGLRFLWGAAVLCAGLQQNEAACRLFAAYCQHHLGVVESGVWLMFGRCCEMAQRPLFAVAAYSRLVALRPTQPVALTQRIAGLQTVGNTAAVPDAMSGAPKPPPSPGGNDASDGDDGKGVLLEREVPLSQSVLWDLQRTFYEDAGPAAWGETGPVPFEITSNAFVANAYASVALPLLPEVTPCDTPLVVVELGAGHGKFGFQFLHAVRAVYNRWRVASGVAEGGAALAWPSVKYIMTDVTESNVALWRSHPGLAELVDAGVLDFALFDAAPRAPPPPTEDVLKLLVSGTVLRAQDLHRVLVVANYLVDTLPCDAYRVDGGDLKVGHVTTTLGRPFVALDPPGDGRQEPPHRLEEYQRQDVSKPLLDHTRTTFVWHAADSPSPSPPPGGAPSHPLDSAAAWARVAASTTAAVGAAGTTRCFTHPRAALQALERLRRLCQPSPTGCFAVMVSDKGHCSLPALVADDDSRDLFVAQHGSISFSVHFPGLAQLFQECLPGGFACLPARPQPRHTSIVTCLLAATPCRQLRGALEAAYAPTATFTPDSYYALLDRLPAVSCSEWQRRFSTVNPGTGLPQRRPGQAPPSFPTMDTCLALLRLGCYDPGAFLVLCYAIQRQVGGASTHQRQQVVVALKHVAELAYMVTSYDANDVVCECARVAFCMGHYGYAVELADASLGMRAALGRAFARHYGAGGRSSASGLARLGWAMTARSGSSTGQASAMLIKGLALEKQGALMDALAVFQQCAAISSKFRGHLERLGRAVGLRAQPAGPPPPGAPALHSQQAYFAKRLRRMLDEGASMASSEARMVLAELERLHDALRAEEPGGE